MSCYGCGEQLVFAEVRNYRGELYHDGCAVEVQRNDVKVVLEQVQRAQVLLELAAQQLSSVPGFADEWTASGPVYNAVKDYWRLVSDRLTALEGETTS